MRPSPSAFPPGDATRPRRALVVLATFVAAAGCTTAAPPSARPVSRPAGARAIAADDSAPPTFPPVPTVTGPLALRVTYPPDNALIEVRDSTFLFGSVGSGDARLTINGAEVPVLPNGAWIAWLPLPPRSAPQWTLVARRGSDSASVVRRFRVPPTRPVLANDGPLQVDSASLRPGPREGRLSNDPVRVSLRAPANAQVQVEAVGATSAQGAGVVRTLQRTTGAPGDSTLWATDLPAHALRVGGRLIARRGADSVVLAVPPVALLDSAGPRYGVVGERAPAAAPTAPDSDRVINARPVAAGGTYKWFLLPGTVAEVTGRSGEMVRLRLDRELEVWVEGAEVRELPLGTAAPVRVAGNARVVARGAEVSDLVIPMGERPPYSVTEDGERLVLELYGTVANTDILRLDSGDRVVQRVAWEQVGRDRARYTITLRQGLLGYLVRWERGALVLRLRRPPAIDATRPLQGLIIAVDAGHPPAGSTGPTGLYEPVATLAIAQRLQALLEGRGALVVMTRSTAEPLGLADRPEIARRAGAHAFVSIHLNALPDGVNPFTAHGTGTYWFTPRSEALARQVQAGMVRRMGLRDLGVYYDNLAVVRPTWMPAVLCEGAFVMLPEQEAWLRMPAFQQAYALGVAEGVERYFRELGGASGR